MNLLFYIIIIVLLLIITFLLGFLTYTFFNITNIMPKSLPNKDDILNYDWLNSKERW